MKLIQVTASYKPAYVYGGPTMSVSKLSEELVTGKADIEVICTTANGNKELEVPIGQTVIVEGVPVKYFRRLTKDHSHFSPSLYIYLWKNTNSRSIVHIQAWWNLISVISCLVSLLKGSKTIISPRGTLSNYSFNNRTSFSKKAFHILVGRQLLKRCHFHVTSLKEEQDILSITPGKSITVIPNFVKLPSNYISSIKESSIIEGDTLKLLFLSRIEEKKGLELLFSSLPGIKNDWHLTIGGSGNETYVENLHKLAQELKIADKITWLGQVSNEHKFDIIKDHHLMVLPSYDENFANVVIECLAMGTPVLITENVGLSDYVRKNELGWICQRTQSSLVETLMAVFNDIVKLQKISKASPGIIYRDFNESNLREQYLNFYYKINKI